MHTVQAARAHNEVLLPFLSQRYTMQANIPTTAVAQDVSCNADSPSLKAAAIRRRQLAQKRRDIVNEYPKWAMWAAGVAAKCKTDTSSAQRATSETIKLIRQMNRANPLWGASRIHGELLKLGLEVAQRSVAKYMIPSSGRPNSSNWKTFLRNHLDSMVSVDFLTSPPSLFRSSTSSSSCPIVDAGFFTSMSSTALRPVGLASNFGRRLHLPLL